jgi:hypothetical protein
LRRRDLAIGEVYKDRRDTSKFENIGILAFADALILADQMSKEHLEFVLEEYR